MKSKKLDSEYLVHNNIVVADGGTIENGYLADRFITLVKRSPTDIWTKCSLCYGVGGFKVDSVKSISMVYDAKNNHHLPQLTATAQPKLLSSGAVWYDGVQTFVRKTSLNKTQILDLTDNGDITVTWRGKLPQLSNTSTLQLFSIFYASTSCFYVRAVGFTNNKLRLSIVSAASTTGIISYTSSDTAVTYSPSDLLELTVTYVASTGVATGFINGNSVGSCNLNSNNTPNTLFANFNNIVNQSNYGISLSNTSNIFSNTTMYSCMMFKGVLTDAEILYLNSIKSVNLDQIVSPNTFTFLDRIQLLNATSYDTKRTERLINNLKANNLWDDCTLVYDTKSGIKEYLLATSFLGDLKDSIDVTQSVPEQQPQYSTNGLIFDGVDDTLTKTGLTKAQVLQLFDVDGNFTFSWTGYLPQLASGNASQLISIYNNGSNLIYLRSVAYIGGTPNTNRLRLNMSLSLGVPIVSSTTPFALAVVHTLTDLLNITIKYSVVTGTYSGYINGDYVGDGATIMGDIKDLGDVSYTLSLSRAATTYSASTMVNCVFFKKLLSDSEIVLLNTILKS